MIIVNICVTIYVVNVVAIIQARYSSTRLPGKVLLLVEGKPMIQRVVERTTQCPLIHRVVLATSVCSDDDPIAHFCDDHGITYFRGDLNDVLRRYYDAAVEFQADIIVRVTGDCPLIDPDVIEDVVKKYQKGDFDYVSNVDPPTFPDGLDVEVFSMETLKKMHHEAELPSEREHVTHYIMNHKHLFKIANVAYTEDLSSHRWTVDEPADVAFMSKIYKAGGDTIGMDDVLHLIKEHPEWVQLNARIQRNAGHAAAFSRDREYLEKKYSNREV